MLDAGLLSDADQQAFAGQLDFGTNEPAPVTGTGSTGEDGSLLDTINRDVGFFARGGITQGSQLEIVGEEGPELVDIAPGSKITPISRLSKKQVLKLKKMGVKGFAEGGIVFEGIDALPLGLRQLQFSRAITPPRGNLLRAANLQLPSLQGFQNLTPGSRNLP